MNYLASVYAEMGALMAAAGLTPRLQFGEVLWWYIIGASGMGFYDADTTAAAQATLGRALHTFLTSNDDPSVNGYADANFLRGAVGRLRGGGAGGGAGAGAVRSVRDPVAVGRERSDATAGCCIT